MPQVRLTLCGRPAVAVGEPPGREVRLPAKSLALLAFLALEPGPQPRAVLTALLWGESPDGKAGASLRQALTQLRGALGEYLRIDRATVGLDPNLPCDLWDFLRSWQQDPEAAIGIDIPHFFGSTTLRNCPAFDEWLDGARTDLIRKYGVVLAQAAHAAAARRDWRRSAELAGRWLGIEPTSDDAAHLLIETRHLAGDEAGALAAFAEHRQRLAATDGREPGPALRELAKRIESRRPWVGPPAREQGWQEAAPALEASLVGRGGEWAALVAAWEEVRTGRGRIVVVEGEAGIGKSRLAEDFGRWVETQGGAVLRSRGFEEGLAVPFASMLEVLRAALDLPGVGGTDPACLAEVARVLPEVRRRFPAIPEASGSPGSSLLFAAVSELLLAAAEERPLAVLIDDLQWWDPESCAMVHYVVRRLERSPVGWCVTLTPGDLDRESPAARLARALRASPAATRIQLAPLSEEEVLGLIRELGRVNEAAAGSRLAARIHEVTGGNPLYVIELLRMFFARGWLTAHPETGEWIVRGRMEGDADVGTLSPTVHETVAQRVARLPMELREILMSISVSGTGCRAEVLSHLHGMSRLRVAAIGDGLVERSLAVEGAGRYRCAHPVIARVVRAEMTAARQREIHRAIALALIEVAAGGGDGVDPGEVAQHAEQGGELRLAYEHALAAARASSDRAAHEEALAWLDLASASAQTAEETAAVDQATAALLQAAGWPEPPPSSRRSGATAALCPSDFDLPEGAP